MPYRDIEKKREADRRGYRRHAEARKAKRRAHYKANPHILRDWKLRREFGITLEQYNRMWKARQGLCDNCGNPQVAGRQLAIDHDHATGEIRGMLCDGCNCSLGLLGEDIPRIEGLVRYLKLFHSRSSLGGF